MTNISEGTVNINQELFTNLELRFVMYIGFIVNKISKGTLKNTMKSEDLNTILLKIKALNNINTIILLVRSKNRSIGVTPLSPTTPISAIAVVKVKYIKIISRNLYMAATMMSINIITQD